MILRDALAADKEKFDYLILDCPPSLGVLTLEVGALNESITVNAETAQLQTQSAERSFSITPSAVQNLPTNEDWPADGAGQIDHYLYGTPKRE